MIEVKKLELEKERGGIRKFFRSVQVRKSLIAILIGAISGFIYYYFTEGKHLDIIPLAGILKSLAIGGAFGLFVTNSPCARGRC